MRWKAEQRRLALPVALCLAVLCTFCTDVHSGLTEGWDDGDLPAPFRIRLGPRYTNLKNNMYFKTHGYPSTLEDVRAAREELARLRQAGLDEQPYAVDLLEYLVAYDQLGGRPVRPWMREFAERLVLLRQQAPEPDLIKLARAHEALGILRELSGDLAGAESAYRRAVETLGDEYPARSQHRTLASLLARTGDFVQARLVLERLLSSGRPENPLWGSKNLGRIGALLVALDDHETARVLLERALSLTQEIEVRLSRGSGAMTHRSNLAVVLARQGDRRQAERLFDQVLEYEESLFRPDDYVSEHHSEHHVPALTRYNLALLHATRGDLPGALGLLRRVSEVQEDRLGPQHPDLAMTLLARANILVRQGDHAAAVPLFEQSISAQRVVGEERSPHLPFGLVSFARSVWATGDETRALELTFEAERLARKQFQWNAVALSQREALRYEALRVSGLDIALTFLVSRDEKPDAAVANRVWEELIRSRSLVLDEMISRQRIVSTASDRESVELRTSLSRLRHELARVALDVAPEEDIATYREQLRVARSEKEHLERLLALGSLPRRVAPTEEIGLDGVATAVGRSAALVSYVRYQRLARQREAGPGSAVRLVEQPSYVAFLLPPGERTVTVVDLGPALPIERLVSEWRRATANDPRLSPGGGSAAVRSYREIGGALRAALWDPVDKKLGERERVLVVPDGVLHLVNLSALPTDDGRYLIESSAPLHYLSTERDMLAMQGPRPERRGLLALGGPDFDVAAIVPPTDGPVDPSRDIVYRSSLRGCDNVRAFRPLPGAEKEIRTLERLWNEQRQAGDRPLGEARVLTGARATEAAFKDLSAGYRITHLATHGFLLSDSCRAAGSSPIENDPLLLSGLALAGANDASDMADGEDGMLTAEEIASLDLAGVEWVVLSGCETGLGELLSSEGVLGLRRSFEIAGVGSLISSLWAVDDDATRLWMEHLYRARHAGLSTAESVRRASLAMLNDARARGKGTHPFTWGAFIGVGDWR